MLKKNPQKLLYSYSKSRKIIFSKLLFGLTSCLGWHRWPGLLLFLAFSKRLGQQNSSARHGPDILLLAPGKEEKAACASHLKEEALPTSSFIHGLKVATSPLFILKTQTTVGTGALRELGRCPGLEVLPATLAYTSIWHCWLCHLIQVQVFLRGAYLWIYRLFNSFIQNLKMFSGKKLL